MNHRVIFVPDDYWTNPPKENTTMTNPIAGDCRRASSLVVHYGTQNQEGVNTVLREAVELGRATELITATLDLFQHVVPQLVTTLGIACISDTVTRLSEDEDADPDCNRAARLITHHANKNVKCINIVLTEACEADRVTPLILATLELYSVICPMIFTHLGLTALQQSVLDFAVREETT
ncbi:hypothetical protein A5759_23295 [Mycobacterium sp. 852014-52144_SCH5372336]|nr:hypothetical protein A5759_23295 [Mycobacterium sp. 852014-52144_SCH5372336]